MKRGKYPEGTVKGRPVRVLNSTINSNGSTDVLVEDKETGEQFLLEGLFMLEYEGQPIEVYPREPLSISVSSGWNDSLYDTIKAWEKAVVETLSGESNDE